MASQDSIPNFVFETRAEPSNIRGCTPAKTNRNRGDDEVDIGRRSGKKNDDNTDVVVGFLENDNHTHPIRLLPIPSSTQTTIAIINQGQNQHHNNNHNNNNNQNGDMSMNMNITENESENENQSKDSRDHIEQKGDDTEYAGPSSQFASRYLNISVFYCIVVFCIML